MAKKPIYILDPDEITKKDEQRIRSWAADKMKKNEYKLDGSRFKHLEIVTSGEVEPEAIDVRTIYPFPELNWHIYRYHNKWNLMLRSWNKLLFVASYAKLD